jgi:hypothetical protein
MRSVRVGRLLADGALARLQRAAVRFPASRSHAYTPAALHTRLARCGQPLLSIA